MLLIERQNSGSLAPITPKGAVRMSSYPAGRSSAVLATDRPRVSM